MLVMMWHDSLKIKRKVTPSSHTETGACMCFYYRLWDSRIARWLKQEDSSVAIAFCSCLLDSGLRFIYQVNVMFPSQVQLAQQMLSVKQVT